MGKDSAVRLLVFALVSFVVAACSGESVNCPFTGRADLAPSAGCFASSEDGLLLVQGLNGKVSVPGGSSRPGESAQCTAFRETWEETGLRLQPRELLRVFSTGFHLYRCERGPLSGDIATRQFYEIRKAFYLPAYSFETYDWRYRQQEEVLQGMLLKTARLPAQE